MADGRPRPTHPARRRMAVRKVNAERQLPPADFIWTLEHFERQQVRIDAGLSLEAAAEFFGVSFGVFYSAEKGERQKRDVFAAAYGAWLRLRIEQVAS